MILAKCPNCRFGFDRKAIASSYDAVGHHECPQCFSKIGPSIVSRLAVFAVAFAGVFAVAFQLDLDIGPQLLIALLPALTITYYVPRAGVVFHFRNIDEV